MGQSPPPGTVSYLWSDSMLVVGALIIICLVSTTPEEIAKAQKRLARHNGRLWGTAALLWLFILVCILN